MEAARTRYEVRVGTLMSDATLSTFRVPVRPTAVPRQTLYRFRVPADRDLSDVLVRLIEGDVEVLEIRQCPNPPRRDRGTAPVAPEEPPRPTGGATSDEDGVVVPLRAAPGPGRPGDDEAPGRRSSRRPRPGTGGDLSAG